MFYVKIHTENAANALSSERDVLVDHCSISNAFYTFQVSASVVVRRAPRESWWLSHATEVSFTRKKLSQKTAQLTCQLRT